MASKPQIRYPQRLWTMCGWKFSLVKGIRRISGPNPTSARQLLWSSPVTRHAIWVLANWGIYETKATSPKRCSIHCLLMVVTANLAEAASRRKGGFGLAGWGWCESQEQCCSRAWETGHRASPARKQADEYECPLSPLLRHIAVCTQSGVRFHSSTSLEILSKTAPRWFQI